MKRKDFLKKALFTGAGSLLLPFSLRSKPSEGAKDQSPEGVGFNHLPNKETRTMNTVYHPAHSRGHANHGWLDTYHTFSFATYQNPQRNNFGVLRVLNDDKVSAGKGFGTHPHENMEIVSIPLEGDLEHRDSMGNVAVIKEGDVQVMSAGTGVYHSEFNKNLDQDVKFLQIWVFPKKRNVTPRYDQISIRDIAKENVFYQILSPIAEDDGVWVHQDAWFSLGKFAVDTQASYTLNKAGNGVYLFVLEGEAKVMGQELKRRDGFGVWDIASLEVETKAGCRLLLMEVPMSL